MRSPSPRHPLVRGWAFVLLIVLLTGCVSLEQMRAQRVPTNVRAGLQFLTAGEEAKAVEQFEAYLQANATDPQAYGFVVQACWAAQKLDMAARYAERGLKAAPNAPAAQRIALYTLLAQVYYQQGDVPKTVQAYKAAYDLAPDDPMRMNDLGYMYAEMPEGRRNLEEALRLTTGAVTKARERNMDEGTIGVLLDSLGWVYYRLERYDEAIATLARAAEMKPDEAAIPLHLALAYHKKGRDAEALVALQRALRIDPRAAALHARDPESRQALLAIQERRAVRPPAPAEEEAGL